MIRPSAIIERPHAVRRPRLHLALSGMALVAGIVFVLPQAAPAAAGQARAVMQVGLRIDPAAPSAAESRGLARVAPAASQSSAATSTPQVLPRAGGGLCWRQPLPDGGFRWRCR